MARVMLLTHCVSGIEDIGRFQRPRARRARGLGLITVADVALEPSSCALSPSDTVAAAAALMLRQETDYAPVCDGGRFVGAVFVEAILQCVADGRSPPSLATVITSQIPTCGKQSLLVDAVRQMIACYLRKIPVVGDAGELVGMLTLSEAGAAAVRDPAVAEVFERFAGSTSLFARRLH